VKHICFTTSA